MTPDIQQMDEIVVKGLTMRTTQKGDTLVYNAGAFKVTPDASTEKLLEKMPGIKVEGGSVEAQGEQVKKVLVDGKEFFGEDVTTAIKNLPAEVIDRVEVFDKLSDQVAFSGVDDGQGYKAINIVTQRGLNQAKFGRFYGSYGFDELYNVSASINLLKDNRRLTLLGMANNVNQQNFATDDLLGVLSSGGGRGGRGGRGGNAFMIGNQSGVSTVKMFGVDYANQWWDKLKVQGSYSFNTTKNTTEALTQREYFSAQLYDETGRDNSRNFNHRINGLVEYKINDNNQLMFRPSLSFQTNDTYSGDRRHRRRRGQYVAELFQKQQRGQFGGVQHFGRPEFHAQIRRQGRPGADGFDQRRSLEKRPGQHQVFADALPESGLDFAVEPVDSEPLERLSGRRPRLVFRTGFRPRQTFVRTARRPVPGQPVEHVQQRLPDPPRRSRLPPAQR